MYPWESKNLKKKKLSQAQGQPEFLLNLYTLTVYSNNVRCFTFIAMQMLYTFFSSYSCLACLCTFLYLFTFCCISHRITEIFYFFLSMIEARSGNKGTLYEDHSVCASATISFFFLVVYWFIKRYWRYAWHITVGYQAIWLALRTIFVYASVYLTKH